MSLNLIWTVLRHPHLPARWKPLLAVLALLAEDDGSNIRISLKTLASYRLDAGLTHPVHVSRVLSELRDAGLVVTVRPGTRWRTKRGSTGRPAMRQINIGNLVTFGPDERAAASDRRAQSRVTRADTHAEVEGVRLAGDS